MGGQLVQLLPPPVTKQMSFYLSCVTRFALPVVLWRREALSLMALPFRLQFAVYESFSVERPHLYLPFHRA
jgi:hypothetical protein